MTRSRCSKSETGDLACSDHKDNDGDKKIDVRNTDMPVDVALQETLRIWLPGVSFAVRRHRLHWN